MARVNEATAPAAGENVGISIPASAVLLFPAG